MFRYKHPRRGESGKSYSFAAGILDDVWGFDPAPFAISPREAMQMDPQQRLLLMLVWEALEDAGLPPSDLGKRDVGVYVGNSSIDHNNRFMFDPAGSDSYMMTGNTGALISNRISYIFDLHGPSMTIDTACSSSLVALDEAVSALRAGQIDTAIVAGVNLLLSPFPFVGFSAATMLSPEGLCRPFDAQAYGYVRAEGGVVLVLKRADDENHHSHRCHSRIIETGVNSDGRTNGVAMPSADYQAKLLQAVYSRADIHPEKLAFVEAHGTGTRVGDPAEADALGRVLGQARPEPLLLGSVKSNIGHLEPASGIVGMLKAMLALEHGRLPASLHFDTPNPDIPFDELNLKIAVKPEELSGDGRARFAGISNFGFGGTNVHVIIEKPSAATTPPKEFEAGCGGVMMLSAKCDPALRALAGDYAEIIKTGTDCDTHELASASLQFRPGLEKRLVVTGNTEEDIGNRLVEFSEGHDAKSVVTGTAEAENLDIVFVYAGNGSQWPGMGLVAYRENAAFRARFDEVDAIFRELAGWSICEIMMSDDIETEMQRVEVAQQMLFAVQSGLTAALQDLGLSPTISVGHSAGEIAAAHAAGALTLEQAAKIIHMRSVHQETVRGKGTMAALLVSNEMALRALEECELPGVEIASINSPRSVTISGPNEEVEEFLKQVKSRRWAGKNLDLDYPFHNALIDPVHDKFIQDLAWLKPGNTNIKFISTVTGDIKSGLELDADYWWQNVREPVRFDTAISKAADLGGRLFLELGPRPILKGFLNDILKNLNISAQVLTSLNKQDPVGIDPLRMTYGRALACGAKIDRSRVFGKNPALRQDLPLYPWQNKPFQLVPETAGAIEAFILTQPPHPLLGQQIRRGDFVWDAQLDCEVLPFLNDHKVDGRMIMPGAGFAEMALAAAAQWLGTDRIELRDMDLIQPLAISPDHSVEVRTRISIESSTVEITSRQRLSGDDWQVHAKCRVAAIPANDMVDAVAPTILAGDTPGHIARLYNISAQHGIDYGPLFRRMTACEEPQENLIKVALDERDPICDPADGETANYLLHPIDLDACFHGLNIIYDRLDLGADKLAFIPVRFGHLRVYLSGKSVHTARIKVADVNRRGGCADFELFAVDGTLVAALSDVRFRATALKNRHSLSETSYSTTHEVLPLPVGGDISGETKDLSFDEAIAMARKTCTIGAGAMEEQGLLLNAAARRVAYDILVSLGDKNGRIDLDRVNRQAADLGNGENNLDQQEIALDAANQRLAIVSNLLAISKHSGLAEAQGEIWQISPDCPLPVSADILKGLLAENPRWLADCILLNHASNSLPEYLQGMNKGRSEDGQTQDIYSPAMLDQLTSSSPVAAMHVDKVAHIATAIINRWPASRPLRVLELGVNGGALTRRILPLIARKHGRLVVADTNKAKLSRLDMSLPGHSSIEFVELGNGSDVLGEGGAFDLLVSGGGLHWLRDGRRHVAHALSKVGAGGISLISAFASDSFHDVVFGQTSGWFSQSIDPLFPLGPMIGSDELMAVCRENGCSDSEYFPLLDGGQDSGLVVAAHAQGDFGTSSIGAPVLNAQDDLLQQDNLPKYPGSGCRVIIATSGATRENDFAEEFSRNLTFLNIKGNDIEGSDLQGSDVEIASIDMATDGIKSGEHGWLQLTDMVERSAQAQGQIEEKSTIDIVYLAGAFEDGLDPLAETALRVSQLTQLVKQAGTSNIRLWIVAPGGARAFTGAGTPSAEQAGIWAYGRTASNEYGDLDIRLVDFSEDLSEAECGGRLADLLSRPGDETELVLTRDGMHALRIKRGLPEVSAPTNHADTDYDCSHYEAPVAALSRTINGSLNGLKWVTTDVREPAMDEVQIELAATGLNFRDVMWAQGLLPDEALEDGFSGPSLGLECSGLVKAVGEGVDDLKVGDRVMALAPASFASHVTVARRAVAKLPDAVDLEAGATIPVAFLTAYYALHHLAALDEGEWVLIHGGAGGVGLAALQVAKWSKARVIMTAGSDEKRGFLKMLGADHVLDSRSLDFVDAVGEITRNENGSGVDVVLNSLAGEAMERSLELLRPFGRFLELGKRDYYGNTKIGLRPLRQNISYFGIDADQLLKHQPKLSERLLEALMELFKSGQFHPLPYRLFDGCDIHGAFRLMQQSGHIGKILVKPPQASDVHRDIHDDLFVADSEGTHIITGGLGGFGLEAACWLADHGAKSIVLTSRTGKMSDEASVTLARLREAGIRVEVACADVSDNDAVHSLLTRLRADQPIKGIMHAAMVLDDTLIQNLTDQQINEVLRPKIVGAEYLDRLTRDDRLDYFVLFSSAAALFGNPGQAHYVTANAYLNGLAQRRGLTGLPALSVGWGAITDVGVLARQSDTAEHLARHTGGVEFTARQGLDLLGRLLASDRLDQEGGVAGKTVVNLAAMNWNRVTDALPIMRKPAFALIAREAASFGGSGPDEIDIPSLIKGLSEEAAREMIAQLLAQEASLILRMPVDEINLKRSMADIGMDSLMGMELHSASLQKLGISLPVTSIGDGTTINDIAAKVLERVQSDQDNGRDGEQTISTDVTTLARQHLGEEIGEEILKDLTDEMLGEENPHDDIAG